MLEFRNVSVSCQHMPILNDISLTEGMRLKYGYKKPQTPFFVKFPALNRQPAASEKRRAVIRSEAAEIAFRNVKIQ